MKHHAFAAMGLFTAAFLAQGAASHSASADPTGFWVKPGSERNAKIEVRKCGKGLCSKIVWLEDPNDSKGKPLRDIRNQNPSQRGRPILGLPIFTGLAPSAPGVWTGKIYNPEDGNTYSVTLTVVSRQQLKLKGCKSWLLCAERVWLRTAPPPAEPKPDETIEASVKPETETAPAAPVEEAKAEPKAESPEPSVQASAAPNAPEPAEVAPAPAPIGLAAEEPVEMVAAPQETPAPNSSDKARSGYRFLNASAASENAAHYSGESVPSMFVMTKPVAADAVPASSAATATPAALQADETVPPPSPKPKPTLQAAASKPMLKPAPKPAAAKPTGQGAPAPLEAEQDADAAATELPPEQTQAAASETLAPPPLTRRQKRLLRRQQMGQQPIFPWLRPN